MGLIMEVTEVFDYLRSVYDAFPVAIRLLILSVFGGLVLIAVLRGLWR